MLTLRTNKIDLQHTSSNDQADLVNAILDDDIVLLLKKLHIFIG